MNPTALALSHFRDPVTIAVMALLIVFKLLIHFGKIKNLELVLHPYSIVKETNYFRLFSADLVHHDWMHLLLNEYLLLIYAGNLENYLNNTGKYGSLEFIAIYLCSCLSGAGMTTLIHRKDFGFSSGGASGSIMGCMFSYILLKPNRKAFYIPGIGPVSNLYFGLICIVALIVYQRRSKNELINHEQHFFGALGGMLMTFALFPGLIK